MFHVALVPAESLADYLNGKPCDFSGDPFAGSFVSFVINPHSGEYTVVSCEG